MTLSVLSILTGMSFIEYELNISRIPLDICPDDSSWKSVGNIIKGRFLRQTQRDDNGGRSGNSGGTVSDKGGEEDSREMRIEVPSVPNMFIPKGVNVNEEVSKRLTTQELHIYWDALTSFRQRTNIAFKDLSAGQKWGVASTFMNSFGYRQRLPDVINIGSKKSATTPLRFFLSFHPDIVNTLTGRSVEFFDKNYHKGIEWYRRNMGFAREEQLVYEKTPNYLIKDSVPERIAQVLSPGTKLILLVRDPVERSISDFRHSQELRNSLDWCMRQTADSEGKRFEESILDDSGNIDPTNPLISASNYAYHLKRWLKYFPKEQFLILDQELIVGYTFLELQRIEKFLNISEYFRPDMFEFDSVIPGTCINVPRKLCPGRGSRGTLSKPRPSNETLRKMRDYFRPFNREFSELTGRTFHWINY